MRVTLLTIFFIFSVSIHAENKPNIVLILIDDLGLTDLKAYGGEIDTPNIDALAEEVCYFPTITPLLSVHHQELCF